MNRRRPRSVAGIVAFVLSVIVLMTGVGGFLYLMVDENWWSVSDASRVVLADTMASDDLLDLRLVRSDEPEPRGPVEKHDAPVVNHWFSPGRRTADAVFRAAADFARAHGWEHQPGLSDHNTWIGYRQDEDGYLLTCMIEVVGTNTWEDPDLTGTIEVVVSYG